jgi:hypothetical protein
MKAYTSRAWVAVGIGLSLIAFGPRHATVRADSTPAFSGQATVVRATLPLVGTLVLADTGPLPQSGGAQEATLLDLGIPGLLSAEVGHASTIGQGDRSRSEASVANLAITAGGNSIAADFLMARAMAKCGPGGASTSGNSEIARLVINGRTIDVTGMPNQTVALPLGVGKVIINEQSTSGPGDITVNALHVVVTDVADIVVSSAHADITCPGPPPSCSGSDFVTGGGWIASPADPGAKANFAVAGGIKNGAFWGHLTYIDHGSLGPRVKGTGVTAYSVPDPTTRDIEGTAEIDSQPGKYQADVSDNGEPGRNDVFVLKLSNGYHAGATLAGGNIQLHKPCH